MNILVSGGAGFIGSNLCQKLLLDGHFVVCLDNLSTGNINNIKNLFEEKNFRFIYHDIIDDNIYQKIDYPIDQIYNLACPASPPHYQLDAHKTIKTCVYGMFNILDFAEINNARVLHTSTSEIYGNPLVHPQTEDYWGNVNVAGPRSCYDEGKRCAESILYSSNTDKIVVRIFNTYGKNMDKNDGRIISNFIVQALQNKKLTIYGDGTQTRSFCYVDDMVNGLIKAMNSNLNITINLGNPNEMSILDIAEIIKQKINQNLEIKFLPLPQDDPIKRKPCIDKAISFLNWEPQINIYKGIDKTIEYFKGIL